MAITTEYEELLRRLIYHRTLLNDLEKDYLLREDPRVSDQIATAKGKISELHDLIDDLVGNDIVARNVGTGSIDLRHLVNGVEMRPTELHMKEDGDKEDKPVLAIVMTDPRNRYSAVFGQISLRMFNVALTKLGYQITKI
jgi:hypothetical protein